MHAQYLILIFVFSLSTSASEKYPCDLHSCAQNKVCRLVQVHCLIPPCGVQPTCVNYQPPVSGCQIGQPILTTSRVPIVCQTDSDCPVNSSCTSVSGNVKRCCWSSPDTNTVKPGTCPIQIDVFGLCVDVCDDDSDCSGSRKCCSNGCGHVCMEPHDPFDPCKKAVCPPDTVCRPLQVQCMTTPCNLVSQCVAVPEKCLEKAVMGPCKGYFVVWNYNKSTKLCEKFVYGGCGGNGNRFPTAERCYSECNKAASPCMKTQCGPNQRCVIEADLNCTCGTCKQRAKCECSKYKCKDCKHGNIIDANGCRTCECDCPVYKCKECTTGYVLDDDGCETCHCITPIPSPVKPGKCPKPGKPFCSVKCGSDQQCTGNWKCCYNGCGLTCMKPVIPPPPPPPHCPSGIPPFLCKWLEKLINTFKKMFDNLDK